RRGSHSVEDSERLRAVLTRVFSARPPSRPDPPVVMSQPGVRADAISPPHLRENALTQNTIANTDPLGGEMQRDRLEDRAARQNEISSFDADAGVGSPFCVGHAAKSRHRRI